MQFADFDVAVTIHFRYIIQPEISEYNPTTHQGHYQHQLLLKHACIYIHICSKYRYRIYVYFVCTKWRTRPSGDWKHWPSCHLLSSVFAVTYVRNKPSALSRGRGLPLAFGRSTKYWTWSYFKRCLSAAAQTLLPAGGEILMQAITTTKARWVFISHCFTAVAAFMHPCAQPRAPAWANFNAAYWTLIWKMVKQSPH